VKGPGIQPGLGEPKSVEWVQENWPAITSLEGAPAMWNGRQTVEDFLKERAQAK
jgi:hypothetical protein